MVALLNFATNIAFITASTRTITLTEVALATVAPPATMRLATLIVDTVSAEHDLNAYVNLLKLDATHVLLGAPDRPTLVSAFPLLMKRRSIAGSGIGGIKETQEMLDFCGKHNIVSDIEIVPTSKINEAYKRLAANDVKYRFVIDIARAQ